MTYIPFRVKNLLIKDNLITFTISVFEDSLKEVINKEFSFDYQKIVFIFLGYIKQIEEKRETGFKLSNLFNKFILNMDEKKIKDYNLKEDIFLDLVVLDKEPDTLEEKLLFFRIDLTTFNYRSFLGDQLSFSSFVNIKKFIYSLISYFSKEKVDEIVFNFVNSNSFSKIQYFSSVYEFQDYVLTRIKEIKKLEAEHGKDINN